MIRKLNRMFQDYMRPKRLALGKKKWDKKNQKIAINDQLIAKNDIIKDLNIKSMLFLRYDGKIGDMVINTLMFREIKKSYPDIKIGVVTRGAAKGVIENSPYVDSIYDYKKKDTDLVSLAKEISNEKYDILIDFTEMLRVKQMKFINLCDAKINMGLDKDNWSLFDISVAPEREFEWTDHVTKRYTSYLKILGIKDPEVNYDVFLSENDRELADNTFRCIEEDKKIIINPYGASKHKTFNNNTLKEIATYISKSGWSGIFVYSPDKYEELSKYIKGLNLENIYVPKGIKSINHTASFIEKSDLVVTPDTSIVHIASALNKPMICIYPPNGGKYGVDHKVWGPLNDNSCMLFCKDKISAHDEIDINTFDIEKVKSMLKDIVIK